MSQFVCFCLLITARVGIKPFPFRADRFWLRRTRYDPDQFCQTMTNIWVRSAASQVVRQSPAYRATY